MAEIQNLKRLKEYRGLIFPYPVKGQGNKKKDQLQGQRQHSKEKLFFIQVGGYSLFSFEIVRARSGKAKRRQSLCREERGRLE